MELATYNLNNLCRVMLTETGKEVIRRERVRIAKLIPHRDWSQFMQWDETGVFEAPLWEIMNLFGPVMEMGFDTPFETNAIQMKMNWSVGRVYKTRGGLSVTVVTPDPLTAKTEAGFLYTYGRDGRCNETTAADLMEMDRSTNQDGIQKAAAVEKSKIEQAEKQSEAK